jgi:hypothetical protein
LQKEILQSYQGFMPQVTEAMIRERQHKNELGSILAREGIP